MPLRDIIDDVIDLALRLVPKQYLPPGEANSSSSQMRGNMALLFGYISDEQQKPDAPEAVKNLNLAPTVDILIDYLKKERSSVQNNAGVGLTKLAQNPMYRQRVRDLNGFESLHQIQMKNVEAKKDRRGTLRGGGIQDIRVWRAVTRTSCVRNSGRWGGSFESFSCADFCLEFGHTHRRVNENVVWIRTVVEHSVNIRVADDIIGKGLNGGVDLLADETVVERKFNRVHTIFLDVHSRDRRALVGTRSFGSTVHIHNWSVLTLEVRIHEERSAGEFASFVGRTNFQRSSSSASLVVGGDGTRGPDVSIVVLVTHRPVHLPVRVFIWLPLRILGTPYLVCLLFPLNFVYTVIVDVNSGNGITSQRTLAQRTISTSVTGIALAFNCLLFVPSTVVGIRHSHVHTLTMATATVRAGDTAATLTFETRETCTLTSCAIANALVTALAVEVGLIPGFRVVFTGQTVSSIVLFANETVCVLVLDLLVSVNLVVGINVAKR